jgi:hypothetical protein
MKGLLISIACRVEKLKVGFRVGIAHEFRGDELGLRPGWSIGRILAAVNEFSLRSLDAANKKNLPSSHGLKKIFRDGSYLKTDRRAIRRRV